MESIITYLFLYQWQKKLVALITAIIIWFFVNHTITATKVIPGVPIRIINLPIDKTIHGLLPNGYLAKRTTLTLSGAKETIEQLEPGDIEVLLDVSNFNNEFILQVAKKNLVSLNPNFNLSKSITSVSNPEVVIKMSDILTEKVLITILPPTGTSPEGYEFLDLWPPTLLQTISGPQDLVMQIKNQGLEWSFNLDTLTKETLDELYHKQPYEDEIIYHIPEKKKKIIIPHLIKGLVQINDPEAAYLKLNFLRQEMLPLNQNLPVNVFYPLKYSETLNPKTYPLATNQFIHFKNQLAFLTVPTFTKNVSQLFLNIVKDNISLEIITAPTTERERLEWSVNFVDENQLEDTYVAYLLSSPKINKHNFPTAKNKERENHFRKRFRLYRTRFSLFISNKYRLEIESRLNDGKIQVHVPNATLTSQSPTNNAN